MKNELKLAIKAFYGAIVGLFYEVMKGYMRVRDLLMDYYKA